MVDRMTRELVAEYARRGLGPNQVSEMWRLGRRAGVEIPATPGQRHLATLTAIDRYTQTFRRREY
jgi:hypothetical protein